MKSTPVKTVILLDNLKRGGVQQGTLLLAPRLDRAKFDIQVWALQFGRKERELAGEFRARGIDVVGFNIRGLGDRPGINLLARRLAEEHVALLNTRSFMPNLVGRLSAMLADTPAVIANYHHTYEHRWTRRYLAAERILSRGTNRFVCVSEAVRRHLQPRLAWREDSVRVIRNGLDLDAFAPIQPDPVFRKTLLGLNSSAAAPFHENSRIVACIGRLTAVKDVPTFLLAAQQVLIQMPSARFLVVGDGEERKRLEALSRETGIADAVFFLGSRSDVPRILQSIDCLVLPSLAEGFPRIVLEAFASGTPVVSTPASGVEEILHHERNGLIVPFRDPLRMAEAVLRTLRNSEETKPRRTQALADVQAYSLGDWVRTCQETFEDVAFEAGKKIDNYSNARRPSRIILGCRSLGFSLSCRALAAASYFRFN